MTFEETAWLKKYVQAGWGGRSENYVQLFTTLSSKTGYAK